MPVRIRMSRAGKRSKPYHKIVVADGRSPRDGKFLEQIGSYDPLLPREHKDRVKVDLDRAKYWLSVGAQPSDRVAKFLATAGLLAPRPRREQTKKNLPRKKTQERLKAAAGEEKPAS
ncbi:MAG: 30S ribosomal protein S16 [Alphaproteobacteria bacterium]|nr:30S ribosomal protein S16 [Alphaproteobacteria bacterium]